MADSPPDAQARGIRTPDQRLRVFVSSTLQELAPERAAARDAITHLRLTPVLFELGARPHPPRDLYRAYLQQSDIFVGIYWQRYGWVAPGMNISGLEDEYRLSGEKPRLIYVKTPSPEREPRLQELINAITAGYKSFSEPEELRDLIEDDLALLIGERFEAAQRAGGAAGSAGGVEGASSELEEALRRTNLPVQRGRLVGREKESRALSELLLSDKVGLVTLTGAGGSGKTRLAMQVSAGLAERFSDGVYFVGLGALRDPALVLPQIAATLGVAESGEQPLLEAVASHLADRDLLLLLDNFEHVLEAAPLVSDLLERCPHVRILVTSRTPLRVRGEREFPVQPLALPGGKHREALTKIREAPAVELFVRRAQDVKPDFELTESNAGAVADICRRLDGLPLAIELAAARIKILSPQAMLARMNSSFLLATSGLLTSAARDLPARQQTLRNSIEWSYDLLDEQDRVLFSRFAVFVGGLTLEGAEEVCATQLRVAGNELRVDELRHSTRNHQPSTRNPPYDVLDGLGSLVENSLVRQDEGVGGEPRFSMLETVYEYARERLEESGELKELKGLHAQFFLQLVERAEPELKRGQQALWFRRLEEEHGNIRAALAWCRSPEGDIEVGLRIAAALGWFWEVRGYLTEGRKWMAGLLERAGGSGRAHDAMSDSARVLGRVFGMAGNLADSQGDYATALTMYEQSLAIWRQRGDTGRVAGMLNNMGLVARNKGDLPRARTLLEESLAIKRKVGNKEPIASTLSNLGIAMINAGDYTAAQAVLDESLVLFQELDDTTGIGTALSNLGTLALMQGDLALARTTFRRALRTYDEVGDVEGIAECLEGVAEIIASEEPVGGGPEPALSLRRDLKTKDLEEAVRLLGTAEVLREESGVPLVAFDRQQYDSYVAAIRAQMDDETFARLRSEGRALPKEEAVARALGGTPPVVSG